MVAFWLLARDNSTLLDGDGVALVKSLFTDFMTSAYPFVLAGATVEVEVGVGEDVGDDVPLEHPIRIEADTNATSASKITAVTFFDMNCFLSEVKILIGPFFSYLFFFPFLN